MCKDFHKTLHPTTPGQFILKSFLEGNLQLAAFQKLFDSLSLKEKAALLCDMMVYAYNHKNGSAKTIGYLALTFFLTLPPRNRNYCKKSLAGDLDSDVFLAFKDGLFLYKKCVEELRWV